MNSSDIKHQLRTTMRQRRRSLANDEQQQCAKQALQVFESRVSEDLFPMAVYLAFDGELDPHEIIQFCWSNEYPIYLPIVKQGEPELSFAAYTAETTLAVNHYGILQPQVDNTLIACSMRSLLMPLTAFDASGARLGMGGGYYDRSLSACEQMPMLVGVGYDFQQVNYCPSESHDIPLDAVLTNTMWLKFNKIKSE